jgi:hypothetical protein
MSYSDLVQGANQLLLCKRASSVGLQKLARVSEDWFQVASTCWETWKQACHELNIHSRSVYDKTWADTYCRALRTRCNANAFILHGA